MKDEEILDVLNKSQRIFPSPTSLDEFDETDHVSQIIIHACNQADDPIDAWNDIEESIEELRRAQIVLNQMEKS